jgi:hypothetical protein
MPRYNFNKIQANTIGLNVNRIDLFVEWFLCFQNLYNDKNETTVKTTLDQKFSGRNIIDVITGFEVKRMVKVQENEQLLLKQLSIYFHPDRNKVLEEVLFRKLVDDPNDNLNHADLCRQMGEFLRNIASGKADLIVVDEFNILKKMLTEIVKNGEDAYLMPGKEIIQKRSTKSSASSAPKPTTTERKHNKYNFSTINFNGFDDVAHQELNAQEFDIFVESVIELNKQHPNIIDSLINVKSLPLQEKRSLRLLMLAFHSDKGVNKALSSRMTLEVQDKIFKLINNIMNNTDFNLPDIENRARVNVRLAASLASGMDGFKKALFSFNKLRYALKAIKPKGEAAYFSEEEKNIKLALLLLLISLPIQNQQLHLLQIIMVMMKIFNGLNVEQVEIVYFILSLIK